MYIIRSELEFAGRFFAALISSAPSIFKISLGYVNDMEIFLHLFAVSVTAFGMKKPLTSFSHNFN